MAFDGGRFPAQGDSMRSRRSTTPEPTETVRERRGTKYGAAIDTIEPELAQEVDLRLITPRGISPDPPPAICSRPISA